jgi:type IV pilus biogenesis protein CpaD/CtpE
MSRAVKRVVFVAIAAGLAGCAPLQPVQPWQKGVLSKAEMSFAGDRQEQAFNEHVYASREGASGGNGANGGGCGCY